MQQREHPQLAQHPDPQTEAIGRRTAQDPHQKVEGRVAKAVVNADPDDPKVQPHGSINEAINLRQNQYRVQEL